MLAVERVEQLRQVLSSLETMSEDQAQVHDKLSLLSSVLLAKEKESEPERIKEEATATATATVGEEQVGRKKTVEAQLQRLSLHWQEIEAEQQHVNQTLELLASLLSGLEQLAAAATTTTSNALVIGGQPKAAGKRSNQETEEELKRKLVDSFEELRAMAEEQLALERSLEAAMTTLTALERAHCGAGATDHSLDKEKEAAAGVEVQALHLQLTKFEEERKAAEAKQQMLQLEIDDLRKELQNEAKQLQKLPILKRQRRQLMAQLQQKTEEEERHKRQRKEVRRELKVWREKCDELSKTLEMERRAREKERELERQREHQREMERKEEQEREEFRRKEREWERIKEDERQQESQRLRQQVLEATQTEEMKKEAEQKEETEPEKEQEDETNKLMVALEEKCQEVQVLRKELEEMENRRMRENGRLKEEKIRQMKLSMRQDAVRKKEMQQLKDQVVALEKRLEQATANSQVAEVENGNDKKVETYDKDKDKKIGKEKELNLLQERVQQLEQELKSATENATQTELAWKAKEREWQNLLEESREKPQKGKEKEEEKEDDRVPRSTPIIQVSGDTAKTMKDRKNSVRLAADLLMIGKKTYHHSASYEVDSAPVAASSSSSSASSLSPSSSPSSPCSSSSSSSNVPVMPKLALPSVTANEEKQMMTCWFYCLSEELILRLLYYLDPADLVRTSLVDSRLFRLSRDASLWLPFCRSMGWPDVLDQSESHSRDWAKLYLERTLRWKNVSCVIVGDAGSGKKSLITAFSSMMSGTGWKRGEELSACMVSVNSYFGQPVLFSLSVFQYPSPSTHFQQQTKNEESEEKEGKGKEKEKEIYDDDDKQPTVIEKEEEDERIQQMLFELQEKRKVDVFVICQSLEDAPRISVQPLDGSHFAENRWKTILERSFPNKQRILAYTKLDLLRASRVQGYPGIAACSALSNRGVIRLFDLVQLSIRRDTSLHQALGLSLSKTNPTTPRGTSSSPSTPQRSLVSASRKTDRPSLPYTASSDSTWLRFFTAASSTRTRRRLISQTHTPQRPVVAAPSPSSNNILYASPSSSASSSASSTSALPASAPTTPRQRLASSTTTSPTLASNGGQAQQPRQRRRRRPSSQQFYLSNNNAAESSIRCILQ